MTFDEKVRKYVVEAFGEFSGDIDYYTQSIKYIAEGFDEDRHLAISDFVEIEYGTDPNSFEHDEFVAELEELLNDKG